MLVVDCMSRSVESNLDTCCQLAITHAARQLLIPCMIPCALDAAAACEHLIHCTTAKQNIQSITCKCLLFRMAPKKQVIFALLTTYAPLKTADCGEHSIWYQ